MKNRKFSLAVMVLMLAISIFLVIKSMDDKPMQMSYPVFLEAIENGEVKQVTLSDAPTLAVVMMSGEAVTVQNPRSDTLKSELLIKGIAVNEGAATSSMAILGLLFGAMLIVLLMQKRVKGATGFAKYANIEAEKAIPDVTFQDVAANDEAIKSMRDLIAFIEKPEHFKKYGARIPRGVLLYGPPGTGKTLMARALAGEAKVPFFAVNGSDFVQVYVGVGASRIRSLFKDARKAGRAVIFVDEIDAIGKKRDNGNDEREQTLNALLTEMSGFSNTDGIVVLAATNRVDTLDEALLRAGRFDRQIEVPLPDLKERLEILKVHARKLPLASDVDFESLARQTAFFSGAKLESVLNEAAICAARKEAAQIDMADVQYAFHAALVGEERKNKETFDMEKQITAAHEAGHAIATLLLLPDSRLERVSIIPSTRGAAGYSMAIAPDRMFFKRQELLNHMQVALAGRAAEEAVFGKDDVTTGAASDFQRAAEIASSMAALWGMGESGVMSMVKEEQEKTAQRLLNEAYQGVLGLLNAHMTELHTLSAELVKMESMTGNEVRDCLSMEIAV